LFAKIEYQVKVSQRVGNLLISVFFDWGFVKSEYWIKDWHSHLICLSPEPDELGWLQLIAVERGQFTKIVGTISSMDTNSFFWC
jgi:hypothetical protein